MTKSMPTRPLSDAQRELVANNLGLAGAVARACGKGSHLDFEERCSAAFLGLCQAAQSFDSDKSRFSTYGMIGARTAIRMAIHDSYIVSIGFDQNRSIMNGIEPQGLISTRIRKQAELATRVRKLPFDGARLPDRDRPTEPERAEDEELCASLLQRLDWRHRLVIRQCVMRGRKLREAASMLGVSTERARQLRNEGLAILREFMERLVGDPTEPIAHRPIEVNDTSASTRRSGRRIDPPLGRRLDPKKNG
jgi:RNA polymerase sigma factor (sigma-70 family)